MKHVSFRQVGNRSVNPIRVNRAFLLILIATAVAASWRPCLAADEPTPPKAACAVVVKKSTAEDAQWRKVVTAIMKKHNASVIKYSASVDESLDALKQKFPRYTCFVTKPEDAGRDFVARVHRLTRKLDDDPYTDTFWGILTGYNAANALAIASHSKPLVVRKVASGTEFATEMVTEGQWYDELVKNKHVKKDPGGKAKELKGPDDTTKPLVDLLNDYKADLMITSGHATERDWQIGFRFRSGQFRCADGRMYGLDRKNARHPIDSPNPKVYMPIGNCLMGHVKDRDCMALAWMNSAGVKQMFGYTVPTWFGYAGWGCLNYFLEQPGRYTFTEAFFANQHALIHRLGTTDDPGMRRGLKFDSNVVAFYGDPAWSARMAPGRLAFEQSLRSSPDGRYTFEFRGDAEDSFGPVDTNGSQRQPRPLVAFFDRRLGNIHIVEGAELEPVIADDFLLVDRPSRCAPGRTYRVVFRAEAMER